MLIFRRSNNIARRASGITASKRHCIQPTSSHAPTTLTYCSSLDAGIIDRTYQTSYYTIVDKNTPPTLFTRRFIHHHTTTPISKVCPDAKTALSLSNLKSGDTIAVGGFGNGGIPETLLNALSSQEDGPTNLTVASLTAGVDSFGLGRLFEAGKVKRMISSYVGENKVRS